MPGVSILTLSSKLLIRLISVLFSLNFAVFFTTATSPPRLSFLISNTFVFFLKMLLSEKVPPFAENFTVNSFSSQFAYKSIKFLFFAIAILLPAFTVSPLPFFSVVQPLKTIPSRANFALFLITSSNERTLLVRFGLVSLTRYVASS